MRHRSNLQVFYTYQTPILAFCCTFFSFLVILTPSSVEAVEVEGLYSATVRVESRDNERERDRAFSMAMREVLLKVSGTEDALKPNAVQRALNNPQSYVESRSYSSFEIEDESTELGPSNIVPASIIELEISFFESEILSLLDDNNLPLWPSNRPNTLLWVVVQEELGLREVLSTNSDETNEILSLIKEEAESRGFPLLFPLLDLEDQQALSANKLWRLDATEISAASARYQAESILAVRIYRSLSGELLGKSLYIFRDRALPLESFEEELNGFIENSLALSAQELSSNYTILLSGGGEIAVSLTVEGISSVKAYAGLLAYVDELTDVNAYQIISVEQGRLVLELSTGGQLRQLIETISLGERLEPIDEPNRNAAGVRLSYRWVQ